MNSLDFYKTAAIISPFFTAILTSIITYYSNVKAKKNDLHYQNRIGECKLILGKLVEYKIFCFGRIAYLNGNEVSPYWEEETGTVVHRTEVAKAVDLNSFYLSKISKTCLENLLSNMSVLCNIEIKIALGERNENIEGSYTIMVDEIENCIKTIKKNM